MRVRACVGFAFIFFSRLALFTFWLRHVRILCIVVIGLVAYRKLIVLQMGGFSSKQTCRVILYFQNLQHLAQLPLFVIYDSIRNVEVLMINLSISIIGPVPILVTL